MNPNDTKIVIIGAGPAGLIAAEILVKAGFAPIVYDRMPTVGRKLLMAGRGGLNLTHSEELSKFVRRYGAADSFLNPFIDAFPPSSLRAWAEELGQPTFIGTSGRVFPKSMKASPLLRAWLVRLQNSGVRFHLRHEWLGWDGNGDLRFRNVSGEEINQSCMATILAMGGASWPRLGSDGGWNQILSQREIIISPFRPANCGFKSQWSEIFRQKFEGQPLKNLAFSFADKTVRGEAIITASGIEGGAIYTLSSLMREAIAAEGQAILHIDLCPGRPISELVQQLSKPRRAQSQSSFLRRVLSLPPVSIGLLHEASGPALPAQPEQLAALMKAVPITLIETSSLERAISTAGGIALSELTDDLMLRKLPGVFAAGEMLDWEAPTGGYLLQATFATGIQAAKGVLSWLASRAQ